MTARYQHGSPAATFSTPLDVDDVTTLGVPAGYVLSEDDRALARPGAELASRIGLNPRAGIGRS